MGVQAAAWAVGLPPAAHDHNQRCTATNQARAAIALWAAAAAAPDGAVTLTDVIRIGSQGGPLITFPDWDGPPMWGVDYAVSDANVADALVDLPISQVAAELAKDWAHWIDPTTPTSDLARRFGLATPVALRPEAATGSSCP